MWSVFFVFLSYLDRNVVRGALDTEKESKEMLSMLDGSLCAKMSMVGENFLYQVSDGAEVVRSLVSPARRLMTCSITVNQLQVKAFMQECRLGLKGQRAAAELQDAPFTHMDEAQLMCREFMKRSQEERKDGNEDLEVQKTVLRRSKRGFTYPGTLWCGAGNMADHYDQLGQFADTDSCCRIHDHCPHVIHAFSSNYGYTNYKWHSICHCDCDNALKMCLRRVNDSSSRIVGQAFFNVIGVPCFDFVYEEQCAERHWYGVCKEYKKLPIAVLRDAVPYDFGGIDVIDVLTVPPVKTSRKSNKEEKPESPTQSSMSGPEEPSLTNVVTAAEDFIKVLATVSTSQSSNAESDKGEAQSSEKKKRKNAGKKKKTTKKRKGKGKGRKRKLKAEVGVKLEEGAAVSPSGSKAEDIKSLSNFISESNSQSSRNTNRVGDSDFELEGKDEPFNEVMKDEPARDEKSVSITSPPTVQKSPVELDSEVPREEITPSTDKPVTQHAAKTTRQRKGRKTKNKKTTLLPHEEVKTTNDSSVGWVPSSDAITPTARPNQQSFTETAASSPVLILKVKRNRSKERGDKEGMKKRRKTSSPSPIVPVPKNNSSVDNLDVIPHTGAPTVLPVPVTEQQSTTRPELHRQKVQLTTLNASFSVLKRQKSKEKGLRKRRRKILVPPPSELNHPQTSAATQQTEPHSERRLLTTATPFIGTKPHRQTTEQQTNPQNTASTASAAALGDTSSVTFTATPFNIVTTRPHATTSAVLALSPRQRSIERVKAQFSRKKKRKAALVSSQQEGRW